MPALKHYPPVVTFHATDCLMYLGAGTAVTMDKARADYPNHVFCACAKDKINVYVRVEENDFEDHLYQPSDIRPADAILSLCRRCMGTHEWEYEREVIEVKSKPKMKAGSDLPSDEEGEQ